LQQRSAFLRPTFSPVPLLLLSRALELEIKARHLVSMSQQAVKKRFGHNLVKAYNALPFEQRILSDEEEEALMKCSNSYDIPNKFFDYWSPVAALRGFSMFPDEEELRLITEKLVSSGDGLPELQP
jgi:hypothetical protein